MKNFDTIQTEEDSQYYDPSYVLIDRIISTTELFPIIHPKKANEMRGKWCELAVVVINKLLNFQRENISYGVYFMEPVDPERDNIPNYK